MAFIINEIDFMALTTDMWKDDNTTYYNCLCTHYLSENFQRKKLILEFKPFH